MGQPERILKAFQIEVQPHQTTRGSETSQYPKEKKETSIPKVAASEMGRA